MVSKARPIENNKFEQTKLVCEFNLWLENALPKEKFRYFLGEYLIGPVGRAALEAYERGTVVLYQRRKDNRFEYWAERINGKM